MNYLVTHYKNLAEQLQSSINHIQQCLYEMDEATPPPRPLPYAQEMTPSRRDDASLQYSQYSSGNNTTNSGYDSNHPFWSSQRGSLFLQNCALLAAALRMPTLDRATLNAINQQGFQTLAAFRAHLQNLANTYANQYGVVMPPLPRSARPSSGPTPPTPPSTYNPRETIIQPINNTGRNRGRGYPTPPR